MSTFTQILKCSVPFLLHPLQVLAHTVKESLFNGLSSNILHRYLPVLVWVYITLSTLMRINQPRDATDSY
jgi:hypothetical protein